MLGGAQVAAAASGTASPDTAGIFAHGVASGDPLPDGVLLWTRVTPVAEAVPGSGAGPEVAVDWEVAVDQNFQRVVASGTTTTGPWRDHTVKVDVGGLAPARWYWYRFRARGTTSPVARTRTAPAAGAHVERMRMGVVSCSNWQAGYFSAYRHLAARDDLDVVLHLGDYIYEYEPGGFQARDVVIRPHDPPVEAITLEHYRRRHAQYKTDPDLRSLHQRLPFITVWDDHESANDAWSGGAQNHTEGAEGTWADRKSASQRAYAEWMPVRYEPGGVEYRRFTFGALAELSMLDLRSYRSKQASSPVDPAIDDPSRTITGDTQMNWLTRGIADCRSQWKLIGNPVMIAPVRFPSTLSTQQREGVAHLTGPPANVDQWDGYTADRDRLFSLLRDNGIHDTVFLTGDIHSAWAAELPHDPLTYPGNRNSVGAELVCTSVTSDNLDDILRVPPRTASLAVEEAIRANNPHVKHLDLDSHGFSVLEVTSARVQMDGFRLADRTDPASAAEHEVSFVVPAGTQHVVPTNEPLR